jgi:hypothetical protein
MGKIHSDVMQKGFKALNSYLGKNGHTTERNLVNNMVERIREDQRAIITERIAG